MRNELHLGYWLRIEVNSLSVSCEHTVSLSTLLETTEKTINTCANIRIGQYFLNTLSFIMKVKNLIFIYGNFETHGNLLNDLFE